MNRFKILRTPEMKPCFAPVDPAEKAKKSPTGSGPGLTTTRPDISGIAGYTGMVGSPPSPEAASDFQSMHGIVVARTGRYR